ncbi:uncharacterized protein LOC124705746 [Lolium rigidum]|uniref:uncharacterized protein LOC124705746 n=1 Tax=Lolium rigidum TaxID=89674 RepID=UPI001F5DB7E8|nr:uncharacterized protein LOC124705746 [Lolium rigidum]
MGRRPDRSVGALSCCRIAVVVIFILCASLMLVMSATTSGVDVSSGTTMSSSPAAQYSGGGQAGEDAYRSSKRRIPKGPDPIHNRRAGKTTIAPRRRD